MSAYGTIPRPSGALRTLVPRTYRTTKPQTFLTVVPVNRASVPSSLFAHLHDLFNGVVGEGRTYPQEELLSEGSFADYYFSYDCFLGILGEEFVVPSAVGSGEEEAWDRDSSVTVEALRKGRDWKDCVAGMYYVKPNYPGRSSHCCNGGFVVDPRHRGLKLGLLLGKSYLHFAPRLGYLASVFNLVYANNTASLAIWDRLGFKRAGLIPRAGRLRKAGGGEEEEWVDAVVYWRSLVPEDRWTARVTREEGLHEV